MVRVFFYNNPQILKKGEKRITDIEWSIHTEMEVPSYILPV
jgi:hypothetical protein